MSNLIAFSFVLFLCFSPDLHAKTTNIVYVDDDVITTHDVESFAKFSLTLQGKPMQASFTKAEKERALQELINQSIKKHEIDLVCKSMLKVKKLITDREVKRFVTSIAKQYSKTYDEYLSELGKIGVSSDMALSYWRTMLEWNKYIQISYQQALDVTDDEVNEYIKNYESEQQSPHYFLYRIVIPLGSNADSLAKKINGMLDSGENFMQLALKYSKSPEAHSGGAIGWVSEKQLSNTSKAVIKKLALGEHSAPIKEGSNLVIYMIRDKSARAPQETVVKARISAFKDLTNDGAEALASLVHEASGISDFIEKAKATFGDAFTISDQRELQLSEIDAEFAGFLSQYSAGSISAPVNTPEGVLVFCIDDVEVLQNKIDKDRVLSILSDKKMNMYSAKKLNELKRVAYIKYVDNR